MLRTAFWLTEFFQFKFTGTDFWNDDQFFFKLLIHIPTSYRAIRLKAFELSESLSEQ